MENVMEKKLSEMSIVELKAATWDLHALIEELRRRLQIMQTEISTRQKEARQDGPNPA